MNGMGKIYDYSFSEFLNEPEAIFAKRKKEILNALDNPDIKRKVYY